MRRMIAIRHQAGPNNPTQVLTRTQTRKPKKPIDLKELGDERDWVMGRFPTKWRPAAVEDDLSEVFPWHQRWRKPRAKDDIDACVTQGEGADLKVLEIPAKYDGLQKGDTVLMILGGSGDYVAKGIARRGEYIGAELWMLTPRHLKNFRPEGGSKDNDTQVLVDLFDADPGMFFPGRVLDATIERCGMLSKIYLDTQEDRKRAGNRVRARLASAAFDNIVWDDGTQILSIAETHDRIQRESGATCAVPARGRAADCLWTKICMSPR